MSGFVHLIYLAISVYAFLILARAVMSWLDPRPGTAVHRLTAALVGLTEPYLGLFRRVIPKWRIGDSGPDFSAVVGLLVLLIVLQLLTSL